MKESALIVFCTAASQEEAEQISRHLVEQHLAACCNIIPELTSVYRWKGEINRDKEVLLLIKTTTRRYDQLEKEIKMFHSYEVPEIIACPVAYGSPAYLDWLADQISGD